jgi:hypothetical protein
MSLDEVSPNQLHTGPPSWERQSKSGAASKLVGGVYFLGPPPDLERGAMGPV